MRHFGIVRKLLFMISLLSLPYNKFGFVMESKPIFPNKKYKEAHALSIRGKTHFYRIVSQRLPEGEALDQQTLVPGTMIELGPETRKFLKEASREAFVEAVKLVNVRKEPE